MKNGSPFQGLRTWLLCIYKNSKGGGGKAEWAEGKVHLPYGPQDSLGSGSGNALRHALSLLSHGPLMGVS